MPQDTPGARHFDPHTEALRAEFQTSHSARLPGLLDEVLIKAVLDGMRRGTWMTNDHDGLGREVILDDVRTFDPESPIYLRGTR
jgi:hypothetical protein